MHQMIKSEDHNNIIKWAWLVKRRLKAATGSLRRIRHSSDPLDLSWVGQLHRPDGPPDGTRE